MNLLNAQQPNADKRIYPRLIVRLPARFWLAVDGDASYKHGHTENISAGGVLLRCFGFDKESVRRLIRDQSDLCLRLRLDSGQTPLAARGRVIRAKECNDDMLLTVQFTGIAPSERDRIHEFMLPHYPRSCS